MDEKIRAAAFDQCERYLSHHPRRSLEAELGVLLEAARASDRADNYGTGALIEDFEAEIAEVLGKPAAVFMPSGTMAQTIALRIWADRTGVRTFGLHPTSHLELHEEHAYRHLHALDGMLLGNAERLLSLDDFPEAPAPLSSVIIELPHLRLAGQLPEWRELERMRAWCSARGVRFHLDGARLWESTPHYEKSPAAISALFDSVYVSFYKGLGGLAGAMLAGEKTFVDEARLWKKRQGGNLVTLFPYLLSARTSFRRRSSMMGAFHRQAVFLREALRGVPAVRVLPEHPHTNILHFHFPGDPGAWEQASFELARDRRVALFRKLERLPDRTGKWELSVGEASLDFAPLEVGELMNELVRRVGAHGNP